MLASAILSSLRLPPWPTPLLYFAAASLIVFGYLFDESTCLWRAITGLPCPGCGMIHAFLALARGDVHAAWGFNPGSFVAGPIIAWTGIQKLRGAG